MVGLTREILDLVISDKIIHLFLLLALLLKVSRKEKLIQFPPKNWLNTKNLVLVLVNLFQMVFSESICSIKSLPFWNSVAAFEMISSS